MHLAEFALRDFVNVERHADWTSVIVFDDIFPRTSPRPPATARPALWTGDVYKVMRDPRADHRPDLICLRVDTEPTGLLLVLGPDPHSTVLERQLDAIAKAIDKPDPQPVPEAVLERRGAVEPDACSTPRSGRVLRDLRERGVSRDEGLPQLRAAIERDFGTGG